MPRFNPAACRGYSTATEVLIWQPRELGFDRLHGQMQFSFHSDLISGVPRVCIGVYVCV